MSLLYPILYSFRRCPYAIRARMSIAYSQMSVELREVKLANKPHALREISSKATVPVLQLSNTDVIDESLDIMLWALQHNDPKGWLSVDEQSWRSLLDENDEQFKTHLDHYKYADRYPEHTMQDYRKQGERFLQQLEQRLQQHTYLLAQHISIADVAIFPFVRQFAHVDKSIFNNLPYPNLQAWLESFLTSDIFLQSMHKYSPWRPGDKPVIFG